MKKRILLILLSCALFLSLAACNFGGNDSDAKNPTGAIWGEGVDTRVVVKKGEDVDVFSMIDKMHMFGLFYSAMLIIMLG